MDINFSSYFEAILVEDAYILDKTFKVTIPILFPIREDKNDGSDSITYNLSQKNIANINELNIEDSIEGTTIFTARNHTDYPYQYMANIHSMERSSGKTEFPGNPTAAGPYVPHWHDIVKPFEFYKFVIDKFNQVKVSKGTKCYGFFINGMNDPDGFVITRIEGAIPLSANDAPTYEN